MDVPIREYASSDEGPVVRLSLRAWAAVFASVEQALGIELFGRLRGDWRAGQEKAVRDVLADPAQRVWVAGADAEPIGFVAATLNTDSLVGEIYMLAVDPAAQDRGVGAALTEVATTGCAGQGCRWRWWRPVVIRAMPPPGASTTRPTSPPYRSSDTSRRCSRGRMVSTGWRAAQNGHSASLQAGPSSIPLALRPGFEPGAERRLRSSLGGRAGRPGRAADGHAAVIDARPSSPKSQ